MQISSTRRPFSRLVSPSTPTPRGVSVVDFAPTAGGLVLGGACAMLGHHLAGDYGHQIAQTIIRKGLPLVADGTIGLECALKALPYLTDRAFQLRVGALSFGVAGFALGAALLWPRED